LLVSLYEISISQATYLVKLGHCTLVLSRVTGQREDSYFQVSSSRAFVHVVGKCYSQ